MKNKKNTTHKIELNKYIDHTLVKRDVTKKEIDAAVKDAIKYKFKSLCIHPQWIEYVKAKLHKAGVLVCVVIGFPFGQQSIATKIFEAKEAMKWGADELDFVINVSRLHDKDVKYLKKEMTEIRKATKGKTIKLILETALLNTEEKKLGTKIGFEAKWDFIKTSTAVGCEGATVEDVKLIKAIVKDKALIKASGGVRNYEQAMAMIHAGANRIGTSNGVQIMQGKEGKAHY